MSPGLLMLILIIWLLLSILGVRDLVQIMEVVTSVSKKDMPQYCWKLRTMRDRDPASFSAIFIIAIALSVTGLFGVYTIIRACLKVWHIK